MFVRLERLHRRSFVLYNYHYITLHYMYICVLGVLSGQGKTTLPVYICVLGVLSGQGKTTLTVYICVLGVLSGQGKTT